MFKKTKSINKTLSSLVKCCKCAFKSTYLVLDAPKSKIQTVQRKFMYLFLNTTDYQGTKNEHNYSALAIFHFV